MERMLRKEPTMAARRTSTLLLAPFVALLALTGCATAYPTAPGPASPDSPGSAAVPRSEHTAPMTAAACLTGKDWALDVDDLAAQLVTEMQGRGLPVLAASGSGTQLLRFAEGGPAEYTTDLTLEITMEPSDGLTSTMRLHQSGTAHGDWSLTSGERIEFSDWESAVALELSLEVGGVVTPLPSADAPLSGPDGAGMSVSCSEDRLETQADPSPYVQRWSTEG
jgi:hypothetical protein